MEPRYPLQKIVAVALGGGEVLVGASRAGRMVADYIEGLVEAHQFARDVVASLALEHFEKSVCLDEPPYRGWCDCYIRTLPVELAERYRLQHVDTWYVKLKLIESEDGDTVVCVSLHPPEHRPKNQKKRRSP